MGAPDNEKEKPEQLVLSTDKKISTKPCVMFCFRSRLPNRVVAPLLKTGQIRFITFSCPTKKYENLDDFSSF
jgi:hypothetical protein